VRPYEASVDRTRLTPGVRSYEANVGRTRLTPGVRSYEADLRQREAAAEAIAEANVETSV
jgi:hypothetical protein